MVRRAGGRTGVLVCAVFAGACSHASLDATAREPSHGAPRVDSAAERGERARAMLRALERGQWPAGVDVVAHELEQSAVAEGPGGRADDARWLAARLLGARYALTRIAGDGDRADAAYARSVGSGGAATACRALAARGRLGTRRGAPSVARGFYLEYERRCPDGDELANVHATLALLDPTIARAESDVAGHARAPNSTAARALRRVVIDPGHGGSDPGAQGPTGLSESVVTLDVARRLAARIASSAAVEVVLTRDADRFVPLEDRAARANDVGADLFVSIHCNSAPNGASRGVSTYVLDTGSDRVAARVAARENGALDSDPLADPELFRILADLRLVGQGSRSMRLAEGIQRGIVAALGAHYEGVVDAGVHVARFHVLVGARMPAVLVELSFLSNPIEEARLREGGYRDALADALAAAILAPGALAP